MSRCTYPGDIAEEVEWYFVVDKGDQRLNDAQADDIVAQLRAVTDDVSCTAKKHIHGVIGAEWEGMHREASSSDCLIVADICSKQQAKHPES